MSAKQPLKETDQYFLKETSYNGSHPPFYNTENFVWVKGLEANYPLILNEIAGLVYGKEEMPPNLNPPYLSSPDAWRNFYFFNFRWYNHKNCLRFPVTYNILEAIPNISFAGITVLEPESEVLPHIGETNAIIRCHLGLKIPGKYLDCGIKVKNEVHDYQEGKVFMFSDAHIHSTWNKTNERRFIMVLDVIHPDFVYKGNWVCANSLAALTIKYVDEKISLIKWTPNLALIFMQKILAAWWFLFLPVQKRFRWFYRNKTV
jgi:aspartyl/asparaginyl beta-hydroxylase (cupin superfamily)